METDVPGNVNPRDRFQRATYFLSVLTKSTTERAGVVGIWTDLGKLNFGEGVPVMTLDPNNIDLSGDVTAQFAPAKAPFGGDSHQRQRDGSASLKIARIGLRPRATITRSSA